MALKTRTTWSKKLDRLRRTKRVRTGLAFSLVLLKIDLFSSVPCFAEHAAKVIKAQNITNFVTIPRKIKSQLKLFIFSLTLTVA